MTTSLDLDRKWRMLEDMLVIRRFEEALIGLYREGHFTSHYHLYIGQEATGVAVMACLGEGDLATTTHRNHGHLLARGADPGRAFAEILGRVDGLNGGRGGTIHLCDPALGFLSTSGVVGGCIGLAVGGGYACRLRGEGKVSVAFFGDGALEEGVSFEALNMAALWRLPVVFLCENNSPGAWGQARGGYPSLIHASEDLLSIPRSVGIEALKVDGTDVDAVHDACTRAVARCRQGQGPVFVEAVTHRWAGSNPLWPDLVTGATDLRMATGEAATEGEHRDWWERQDPVLRLSRELAATAGGVQRLEALDRRVAERIEAARSFALASPFPEGATALDQVFA